MVQSSQNLSGVDTSPHPIHVSYMSLGLGSLGLLASGIGRLLFWSSGFEVRSSWALVVLGPILMAIAITLHIEHIGKRIGRAPVVLGIIGLVIWSLTSLPFLLNPELYSLENHANWLRINWAGFAAARVLFSLSFFLVLARKESLLEHGEMDAARKIHASFATLTYAAVGMLLYGLAGFSSLSGSGQYGSRFTYGLLVVGPALIAIAIINHIDHLSRVIGKPAVICGVLGSALWAVSVLPIAIKPSLGEFAGNWDKITLYGFNGCGLILGGISIGLVLMRKRSQDALAA
ncbi:unannotated protein [freshwater metagenome]|uniref:Unannotated protein n=1 Tax=freshwater metagenome TaxID=449393 RepID=A0A6J7K5N1_9ZZZZ|nr:hypothetical protein [Actinomycetota bacterium]